MSKSVLIVGGSGQIGSEIARLLKAQGKTVRTTTSKKDGAGTKDGIERVYLNLASGEGLKAAFEGVDRAFFLSPGGYADQYAMLSPLVQEAKRRGLEKVVLMTAFGANADEKSPMRRAEVELEKSGLSYNIIRPNWFMQNFHTFWVHGIKTEGKILLPAGNAKVSFIDTRDISEVAAKLLFDDRFKNQALDLTGPESIDHDQVARALSEVTGQRITYQEISPETLKQGLLAAGLPKDYSEFLLVILGYLKAGYNAAVTSNVKAVLGREPRSFATYAKDFKAAYL